MARIERPLWEKVQAIREQRLMHGDGIVHTDVISEVARVKAVDVKLLSPQKQREYRQRLARRF